MVTDSRLSRPAFGLMVLAIAACSGTIGEPSGASTQAPTKVAAAATPASTETPVTTATPGATPTAKATATASPEALAPNCLDRPAPPWVTGASDPNDDVPDPRGRIVFGVPQSNDVGQVIAPLFAVDPDGSDLVQLLDCEVERPRFSSDGSRLAFGIVMNDGSWQVATSAADGTDLTVITELPLVGQEEKTGTPDWSPDGSWLVYADNHTIWRIDSDGSNNEMLGIDAFDWEPRFSDDGSQIVFLRGDFQKGVSEPWIRELATGDERSVFGHNTRELEHPDWSPDGRWIVYNQLIDPTGEHAEQIERMPSDDPDAIQDVLVPASEHFSYKPAYSPDGESLVFGCNGALCTSDADGSNVTVVLEVHDVELNHFAWGPLPITD